MDEDHKEYWEELLEFNRQPPPSGSTADDAGEGINAASFKGMDEDDKENPFSSPLVLSENLKKTQIGDEKKLNIPAGQQQHNLCEKCLTTSDDLHRLVVTANKDACKYFPLATVFRSTDNFLQLEDEEGKPWMFEFSYLKVSQIYEFTEAWSSYVKEKQLGIGDFVFIQRHRTVSSRLSIDFRRRNNSLLYENPAPLTMSIGDGGSALQSDNFQCHDPAPSTISFMDGDAPLQLTPPFQSDNFPCHDPAPSTMSFEDGGAALQLHPCQDPFPCHDLAPPTISSGDGGAAPRDCIYLLPDSVTSSETLEQPRVSGYSITGVDPILVISCGYNQSSEERYFISYIFNELRLRGFAPLGYDLSRSPVNGNQDLLDKSQLGIIIFSMNYVSSRECMDGFVALMDHSKANELMLFPVFFEVEFCNVKDQAGSFEKAFAQFENSVQASQVLKWKAAVKELTSTDRYHQYKKGDEVMLAKNIVRDVQVNSKTGSNLTDSLQLSYILSLLNSSQSSAPHIVGLWGMAGIGKTTFSREIFRTQVMLEMPKSWLEGLAGFLFATEKNWKVRMSLIEELVNYASGNPLALRALCSSIQKQCISGEEEHLSILHHPTIEIRDAFGGIFRELDDNEKNTFLDLACFFKGENKDHVVNILDGCGFLTDLGISGLIDESLISLVDNRIEMPNIFQDMGRFVVRQEHEEAGKRSRLSDSSDIVDVLTNNSSLEMLKRIILSHSRQLTDFSWLSMATNLEHIDLEGCTSLVEVNSSSILHHRKLTFLSLKDCSHLRIIPNTAHLESLEVLNLSGCSELEHLEDFSPNLTKIYLAGTAIKEIPSSVVALTRLVTLDVGNCNRLQHLPPEINLKAVVGFTPSQPGQPVCTSYFHTGICSKGPACSSDHPTLSTHKNTSSIASETQVHVELIRALTHENPSSNNLEEVSTKKPRIHRTTSFVTSGTLDLNQQEIGFSFFNQPESSSPLGASLNRVDAASVMTDLEDKCFLNVSYNRLEMHDLLYTMGKEIGYESSVEREGKRPRAKNLERLDLEGCKSLVMLGSSIEQMNKLIYLNLRECTSLESLPEGINLKSLKTLILSGCSNLQEFQIISENIESLYLDGSTIQRVAERIESLRNLILLNLKNCCRLKCLPNDLYKLKSLQELILSGCSALESLPPIKEEMGCLEILLMDGTSIKQTPETIFLSNLKVFSFCGSSIEDSTELALLPFSGNSCLSDLYLTNCNIYKLPDNFSSLHSLRSLCLSRNNIETLPESIEKLHCLLFLDLKHCRRLNSLPVLPPNIQYVDAHGCVSLEKVAKPVTVPLVTERMHTTFIFTDCFKLNRAEQEAIVAQAQLKSQLLARTSLQHNHKGLVLDPLVAVCFPGSDIPSWFCHQSMGSSIETNLLPHWCNNKFIGASLGVVVTFKDHEGRHANRLSVRCKCRFQNRNGQSISFSFCLGAGNESCGSSCHEPRKLGSDHVFISFNNCNVPVFQWNEEINDGNRCRPTSASFEFYLTDGTERKLERCKVTRCGMSLLYAPDENDRGFQGTRVTDTVERTSSEAFVPIRGRSHSQVGERRNGRMRDEIPL
ncbi:hypothetical protein Bca101_007286 [Brassica carinata]